MDKLLWLEDSHEIAGFENAFCVIYIKNISKAQVETISLKPAVFETHDSIQTNFFFISYDQLHWLSYWTWNIKCFKMKCFAVKSYIFVNILLKLEVCNFNGIVRKGILAALLLRHPPLDPACPLFKIFVFPPLFSAPPSFKVF